MHSDTDGQGDIGRATEVDLERRRLLAVTGTGILLGGIMSSMAPASAAAGKKLRWGIVGTGYIADLVAPRIREAPSAELTAVSSRRMATAADFAAEHGIARAFDAWETMIDWDGIDAVYVATPTSVRETISIAAAERGKHVLAEKPFASLPSVQRITRACRDNGVAFMDGTHFVHHPRTQAVRDATPAAVGWPATLDSAFLFSLTDRGNIRFDTTLEPMGAIGDAGWYNMRAIVEYLDPDILPTSVHCVARRDPETNAVISASGVLHFTDGASSTFTCGFDSGALVMDLRLTGSRGALWMDDFVLPESPQNAVFTRRTGGLDALDEVAVDARLPAATLMIEAMADAASQIGRRERWMQAAERTQALLDAAWNAAVANGNPRSDG
jgi:predicted dehydrogenase